MKAMVIAACCILCLVALGLGSACSDGEGRLVKISPVKGWNDSHPAWSPDGSRIGFVLFEFYRSSSGLRRVMCRHHTNSITASM